MTLLEKIEFVLENTSSESAAKLINSVDQMNEVSIIKNRLWKDTKVFTSKLNENSMKSAMIIAINNGII